MHATSKLQQLEQGLVEEKKAVALRDSILKLDSNREFRNVVLDKFFVESAAAYVRQSADPALDDRQRADALAMAQAAGHFKRWLSTQLMIGDAAAERIPEYESMIESVRAGEDDENEEEAE